MTEEERLEHNSWSLRLPIYLMKDWERLDKLYPIYYTDSLKLYCKTISDQIAWCGDIWAQTLAEWIKLNVGLPAFDEHWDRFNKIYANQIGI